jgi:hypothetical protein
MRSTSAGSRRNPSRSRRAVSNVTERPRHRLHPSAIPMHTVDIHRWSIVYAAVDFKRSERMQLMEGKP